MVPLPPDPTVPYLPGVNPVCPAGQLICYQELEALLTARDDTLGCDHDAIFNDAYLTITDALIAAENTGFFQRPDRVNHEARQYAQEYLDNYTRFHEGNQAANSPSWNVALEAAQDQSVTATGDLLLALNAHIQRDNPIRAVEQSEGVLRTADAMPEATGRYDHDRVNDVLQNSMEPMLAHLAAHYDPTIDDGQELFGTVMDPDGLYAVVFGWREESWRNAEELRHARDSGGVDGPEYQAKLAQIEDTALTSALLIKAATLTTPEQNEARNAYCATHR